jgi:hypothetical protein
VPWRKNLKPAAERVVSTTPKNPPPESAAKGPAKSGSTTKLKINLKAVKRPDTKITEKTDKLPPVKLNPVPNKPDEGKVFKEVTTIPLQRVASKAQHEARKNSNAPPAPPPLPPGIPPPPPPPPGFGINYTFLFQITVFIHFLAKPPKPPKVQAKIEQLRKPCRKRPDFGQLLKEIESGRKLNHVQCNDRSKPIIPRMKSSGKVLNNYKINLY